jgi:hypothetical protein
LQQLFQQRLPHLNLLLQLLDAIAQEQDEEMRSHFAAEREEKRSPLG